MQALLENEIVSLYTKNEAVSEFDSLMEKAKTADPMLKSKIENDIVSRGMKFVPELINHIQNTKGVTRGICAMCLIRIGNACVSFVQEASKANREFAWAANYIVNEIQG